ncbi:hypothetical protein [Tuwongella immobilis]|uniref:hypothetical protein n=1 Tax=Tuwongella immobilis TaxID=692036 RepID=UPI0013A6D98C|nr:hypothetical protein [Tuwongella immobilis]
MPIVASQPGDLGRSILTTIRICGLSGTPSAIAGKMRLRLPIGTAARPVSLPNAERRTGIFAISGDGISAEFPAKIGEMSMVVAVADWPTRWTGGICP